MVARWLVDHEFLVITPLDVEQPVIVNGQAVTFWEVLLEHPLAPSRTWTIFCVTFTHCPSSPIDLGGLNPFVRLPQRIDDAVGLDEDDVASTWLPSAPASNRLPAGSPQKTPMAVVPGRLSV